MQHVERKYGAKKPVRRLRRAGETCIEMCVICTGVDWICVCLSGSCEGLSSSI
jgi:hypothetical protein